MTERNELMEMPRVLKLLREDLSSRLQKANGTNDRQLRNELNYSISALDLMKEMAECLDEIQRATNQDWYRYGEVLKKFKEWE